MRFSKLAWFLVLASCMFGGCQTESSVVKYVNGKLTVFDCGDHIARNFELCQDVGRLDSQGRMFVQVRLRNKNSENYHCKCRFVWIDGLGKEMKSNAVDRQVVLKACDALVLGETAPFDKVADFRMEIRPAN